MLDVVGDVLLPLAEVMDVDPDRLAGFANFVFFEFFIFPNVTNDEV